MNLQPLTVEGRNKTFGGCLSLLAESLFNADSAGKIQYPDIFFRRNGMLKLAAFRLGELFQMRERRILIHNTDIDVISVSVMKVTKDSFGIACLARQEQMADNEPPFHHTVPGAEHRSFYLAEHFPDCQAGFLKIIGGMRKSLAGLLYTSIGEPICWTRPLFIMTILSAIVIASVWSWVT